MAVDPPGPALKLARVALAEARTSIKAARTTLAEARMALKLARTILKEARASLDPPGATFGEARAIFEAAGTAFARFCVQKEYGSERRTYLKSEHRGEIAMADWYPTRVTDLIPWHTNFNTQATASGTTHGLTAGQVTQIAADLSFVTLLVNQLQAVSDYAQAVTAYKEVVFNSAPGTVLPTVPTVPALIVVPIGGISAIQARTRQYAAIIKASVGYTSSVGELYGIVAAAAGPLVAPSISRATPTPGTSHVVLTLAKGGYDVIAIDMKRGGGAFTQVGVSQTAEFTDVTAPLVAGQPEQREYRCQGMLNNARTGDLSATVSAVTVP